MHFWLCSRMNFKKIKVVCVDTFSRGIWICNPNLKKNQLEKLTYHREWVTWKGQEAGSKMVEIRLFFFQCPRNLLSQHNHGHLTLKWNILRSCSPLMGSSSLLLCHQANLASLLEQLAQLVYVSGTLWPFEYRLTSRWYRFFSA